MNLLIQHNFQNDDGQVEFLVGLGLILMSQMLLPCYAAQEIESASEEFMSDFQQCNWVDADVKVKKSILFFMGNLSLPVLKFNLFGIVDVNLKTFLSVSMIEFYLVF